MKSSDVVYICILNPTDVGRYILIAKGTSVTFNLPKKGRHVWIEAQVNGTLVGVACLAESGGRMKSAFVRPEYRSQGIYSQLYHLRVVIARQWGLKQLTTFTSAMSQPVFFKNGWKIARNDPTKKAIYMTKELTYDD